MLKIKLTNKMFVGYFKFYYILSGILQWKLKLKKNQKY